MSINPWDEWLPGVLNKEQVESLSQYGYIELDPSDEVTAASIDLSLSDEAYRMEMGCIKPSHSVPYESMLRSPFASRQSQSGDGFFELEKGSTYVFKLRAKLTAKASKIYGLATAKSSVGRVDVLARLIVDGMDKYEYFDPKWITSGNMYVEISPITFKIKFKAGIRLTQLRLFYGDPRYAKIQGEEVCKTVLGEDSNEPVLTLDLAPEVIGGQLASAFCAETPDLDYIDLGAAKSSIDPRGYWQLRQTDEHGRLQIESERFYLLKSKEKLWVPKGVAIYCEASDETIGEMRIHYAGFAHPGFGMDEEGRQKRTPLIFEVRGHQVRANLRNGERMANIVFYRMSEDSTMLEGSYSGQTLKLSKIFADWPS